VAYTCIFWLLSVFRRLCSTGVPDGVKTPNRFPEIRHVQADDSRETDAFHVPFEVVL
jgi:hypothetical protein